LIFYNLFVFGAFQVCIVTLNLGVSSNAIPPGLKVAFGCYKGIVYFILGTLKVFSESTFMITYFNIKNTLI